MTHTNPTSFTVTRILKRCIKISKEKIVKTFMWFQTNWIGKNFHHTLMKKFTIFLIQNLWKNNQQRRRNIQKEKAKPKQLNLISINLWTKQITKISIKMVKLKTLRKKTIKDLIKKYLAKDLKIKKIN